MIKPPEEMKIMKTKRILLLAAAASLLTLANSCTKEGTRLFRGNYSFKTSGTLTVHRDTDTTFTQKWDADAGQMVPDTVIKEYPEPIILNILTESGQMDITEMDSDEGQVVVSMNVTSGPMAVLYAQAQGDSLSIASQPRRVTVIMSEQGGGLNDATRITAGAELAVSGTAHRYDDIILFDLKYEGDFDSASSHYEILQSSVVCRAKANK